MNIAINSEASILIYRDGWYYLLVTHGSCCQGANSTYNIRMGRSRKVTGPYLDNMGVDMIEGGGKLFAASRGRHIGPGHFGLLDLGQGVQKFSLHYEADLDRGGVSVLDIRPLLWRDGWPVAGDNLVAGIVHHRIRAYRHRARARGARISRRRISAARPSWQAERPAAVHRPSRQPRVRPSRTRSPRRSRRTGPPPAACASRPPCCRPSRNG